MMKKNILFGLCIGFITLSTWTACLEPESATASTNVVVHNDLSASIESITVEDESVIEEKEVIVEKEVIEEKLIEFSERVISDAVEQVYEQYLLRVDTTNNVVEVFGSNSGEESMGLVKTMLCSVGLEESPTPLGKFEIYERYRWRPLFGDVYGQYAVRFNGHILFHSVPYTSQDESMLKAGEYNKLGEAASMGCVRLSVADAKWIYDNCVNGTIVEVVKGEKSTKPRAIKVSEYSEYAGWDPSNPCVNNPWIEKLPKIKNVKDIKIVEGCDKELLQTVLQEVNGVDYDGSALNVFIVNIAEIDLTEVGTYEIVYSTTGVYGATVYESASIEVVDSIDSK